MNHNLILLGLADVFFVTGFGLIDPILAIFIKEELAGGTILSVGLASAVFLIVKSVIQLPFSRYVDKHDDQRRWIILGSLINTTVPIIYIFAGSINTIFIAQLILGIGSGISYPAWLGLWSHSLDKHHESFEWSMYSTLVGIATAITAAVGAIIAQSAGFTFTFVIVTILTLVGSFILFGLEHKKIKKNIITSKAVKVVRGVR